MQLNYKAFSLLFGFLVWFVATLAFRYAGHLFFLTDKPLVLLGLYLGVVPVLGLLTLWVFKKYRLSGLERVNSAVLMAIPGMVLDTLCIEWFEVVFPTLASEVGLTFSSWLLWVYAVVLIWGSLETAPKPSNP